MGSNDPVKRNEFALPPSNDRDAIILIVASGLFLLFVIAGVIFG